MEKAFPFAAVVHLYTLILYILAFAIQKRANVEDLHIIFNSSKQNDFTNWKWRIYTKSEFQLVSALSLSLQNGNFHNLYKHIRYQISHYAIIHVGNLIN